MPTVPLSGTNVRLLTGVPFTNDYKYTRWFDSRDEQLSWFTSRFVIHSMSDANFQRIEGSHFIRVNKSIDDLWNVNYLMFQNTQYNSKWFYAFVTNIEYVNNNLTHVHFNIDILQTWRFDIEFQPSYVTREHRPLWDEDGLPIVNTVDEGLHYGTEYETVAVDNWLPSQGIFYLVTVSKSLLHGPDANKIQSTLNGMPSPLNYYVHPFKLDGTTPDAVLNGDFGLTDILDVLTNIFSQDDAVNNIAAMYVTDYLGISNSYDGTKITFNPDYFEGAMISDNVHANVQTIHLKKLPNYEPLTYSGGLKYNNYKPVTESKLLMHPYTVLVLDDLRGNRTEIKNEYIDDKYLNLYCQGSIGTSNKVAYAVQNYLSGKLENEEDKLRLSLEHGVINSDPNDVPILSDFLSAYLQGNRNTIQNQKSSILFNGLMSSLGGSLQGAGNAMGHNRTYRDGTAYKIGVSPFGVAQGGLNAIQGAGNAVLELQGIQAKQKDIANTPPQLVKMGGNTAFDYGNNRNGLYIIRKQIKDEYITKLSHFFNMFGYKTNEVKMPNLHTRRYWNYIQTSSCIIKGTMNTNDLNSIKEIFDKGITLWHTDDIGNYSLENEVL